MTSDQELLTSQQVALLEYIRQAMPVDQAIRMAGMDFDKAAQFLAVDERGLQAVEFSKTLHTLSFNITKDLITSQLYGAMARSASTSEDVMCLKEIAKIHGLYENKITLINGKPEEETPGQKSLKRIQRMDDDDLLEELALTGLDMELLPQKIVRVKVEKVIDTFVEDGDFEDAE